MGTLICIFCHSQMEPVDKVDILQFKDGYYLGKKCHCSNLWVKQSSAIKTFLRAFELMQAVNELNEVIQKGGEIDG